MGGYRSLYKWKEATKWCLLCWTTVRVNWDRTDRAHKALGLARCRGARCGGRCWEAICILFVLPHLLEWNPPSEKRHSCLQVAVFCPDVWAGLNGANWFYLHVELSRRLLVQGHHLGNRHIAGAAWGGKWHGARLWSDPGLFHSVPCMCQCHLGETAPCSVSRSHHSWYLLLAKPGSLKVRVWLRKGHGWWCLVSAILKRGEAATWMIPSKHWD